MSYPTTKRYDVVVIGAGICGLAHALVAARGGRRVLVVDRDAQANGASVRNFGFVTVTGQQRGECWNRAMRSREIWEDVASEASIPILQRGLAVATRRPEARAVLEAFLATEMGAGCELFEPQDARKRFPMFAKAREPATVLYSPHELRVDSREAIPRLAAWLAEAHDVTFLRETAVHSVTPHIATSRGVIATDAAIVCPGDDFHSLFSERLSLYALTRCKLHMMRLAPLPNGLLDAPVMSDLGLVRYLGYAELPQAEPLKRRLEREQPAHLANGIHLIAVQNADGSLVVGDSHHYAATPDPFAPEAVDDLILDEFEHVFGVRAAVRERWTGTYASSVDRPCSDRQTVGRRADRSHNKWYRRQHIVCHRRGSRRRSFWLRGERMMSAQNLKAVIFDWAGTIVDHGSLAPMGAFVDAFAEFGIAIGIDEARGPMGMAKRPHIAALMAMPRIAEEWRRVHGAAPTEADVSRVYDVFVPKNISVASRYADLVPGAASVAEALRRRGLKIGTTTGYTREIMAEITAVAARQGFTADAMACTGDAPDGRPTPFLIYKVLLDLAIWPSWATVKVDDTEVGISEGLNAGAWTVGVAVTGNVFGLSMADTKALASEDFVGRRAAATEKLASAGAHYVIDSVAELMPIVAEIEGRLARGERP